MKTARVPPCLVDRAAWDLDPGHPPVDQLVTACLDQCPALAMCRELDRGDCYGVVAGQHRPWPTPAALATAYRAGAVTRVAAGVQASLSTTNPGALLPDATHFARLYGTSATVVRSAMKWLVEQNVLPAAPTRKHWFRAPDRKVTAA